MYIKVDEEMKPIPRSLSPYVKRSAELFRVARVAGK